MVKNPTPKQKAELWKLCQRFVEDNRISCGESICQCDHVIAAAYDFLAEMCEVVGYDDSEDDS